MPDALDVRSVWDFQRPAESEHRFRGLLLEAEGRSDGATALELQTQIARARGLQGDFASAHEILDAVADSLDDDTPVARLRYLLERGRVLNSSGHPEEARPYFEEAWEYGRTIAHHELAVDAAHMIAIVAPSPERRAWNERAMRYAEDSGDPAAMSWLGSLYNNMGWDAHDAGDYSEALALHERCWAWHRERRTGSGERIAKWSVAKQLRFLGRSEEALSMQRELLTEYERDEPGGEGFVHEELAELLLAEGRPEAARPHCAAAFELLQQYDWVEEERLARLRRCSSG